MPKFVIERDFPGAGKLTPADLKSISQKSCGVLSSLGPSVQWVHSYVTADRLYCIYYATDDPSRSRAHWRGTDAIYGRAGNGTLLLVTGPLPSA